MALQKSIQQDNGIIANYHRISSILYEYNTTLITIKSYISEAIRNIEQEEQECMNNYGNYANRAGYYSDLSFERELTPEEQEDYSFCQASYNRAMELLCSIKNRTVNEETYKFENQTILNWDDAYDALKTLPLFEDAIDC